MFERNPVLFTTEQLAWVWSYRQAVILFDDIDASCIGRVCSGVTEKNWKRFLQIYGLRRGAHTRVLDQKLDVRSELHSSFSRAIVLGDTERQLNERWKEGISLLRPIAGKQLRSMTSKLLWFYHPCHMTMYDSYALLGLTKWLKERNKKITEADVREEYLSKFDCFYASSGEMISFAAKFSDRTYPYFRRVADIRLWLSGNPSNERILDSFREAINHLPIRVSSS